MLSEPVSILAVQGNLIKLQTSRKAACGKCNLKGGCGQYLLSRDSESLWLNADDLTNTMNKPQPAAALVPGSQVRLRMAGNAVARLALIFYMLPLLALLAATLLASALTANEAWLAISALAGLGAGLALLPRTLRLLSKRCRPVLESMDGMDTPESLPELHHES